ncbi:MAG: NgoFVII family restriction endonuclease [Lachnospiraceae bacterium]|nr:NgoFVII family restriction endonuclease [Lachnospiraceae bacterium]
MLFYENLEKIIFHRNELFRCDELVILSGYVGPHPVHRLQTLPLKSTVIYGMYGSEGIQKSLHTALLHENEISDNVNILYSSMPVHAKCYIWKNRGEVVHALVGSANFSTNGLTTPYKEVLAETTADTFEPLDHYLNMIMADAISCYDAVVKDNKQGRRESLINNDTNDLNVCRMPLYIVEKGKEVVPTASGINWGMAKLAGSHVNINDAYIRIGKDLLKKYPLLFPMKQKEPTRSGNVLRKDHRHNDSIEIIWDDGTTMTGLLEGSVSKVENNQTVLYPKQISTTPRKAILGKYLRQRMGVSEGKAITIADLERYGRKTVDVSLQGEGIYYFDFSVEAKRRKNVRDQQQLQSDREKNRDRIMNYRFFTE